VKALPRVRLKQQLKRARISQERIGDAAGVTRTMVNHVLNGRAKSQKVMAAIERLLAEQAEHVVA
jgi:transcriptional regulator with XRE-family HTH domain